MKFESGVWGQISLCGLMYKSQIVCKACLEQLEGNFEQGGERIKNSPFLSERERVGLASLHGVCGLEVVQMMPKGELYPLLKPQLEWLALEVGVCV